MTLPAPVTAPVTPPSRCLTAWRERLTGASAVPLDATPLADAEPYELRAVLQGVRDAFVAEGFPVSDRAVPVPVAAAEVAARLDAGVQALGRYVQALHVLGEMKDTIACDVTRARDELGYEPATSLVPGMRESIRWCLERGDAL